MTEHMHRRRRYCLEDVWFLTLQLGKPNQAFVFQLENVFNNSKILPQVLLTFKMPKPPFMCSLFLNQILPSTNNNSISDLCT